MLTSTGPLYNEYKFQPQRSSSKMLEDFDGDRRRFLRAMFAKARKGRTWFALDIAATAAALGERRERIVAALNHFEDRSDLILKVASLRRGYRFVQRPADPDALAQTLHSRFQESETRDIARIGQVVALASMEGCTVRHVLDYFGESLATDCGHCDRCLGESISPLPPHRDAALSDVDMAVIPSLVNEQHAALESPRQLTRFLCGLTSPAASRAELGRDNRFGRFSHMRFHVVMRAVESVMSKE